MGDTIEPTEAQVVQAEPEGQAVQAEPAGSPDWERAADKYRAQRDEARKQAEEYQRQLDELNKKGDIDDLKRELEAEREKSSQAAKKAEFDRVNIGRLAKEGCVDIDVALGLLDENGDVEGLKKAKPYLFQQPGSTGLKPAGSPGKAFDAIDKAMGVKH